MGDLVDFHKIPGRTRKIISVPPTGARILFFTGVRYQRWAQDSVDDAPDPKPTSSSSGNGRGRRRQKRA